MRPNFRAIIALFALGLLVASGIAGYATGSGHTYVVQPGDSLWAISRQAGITVSALASANDLDPNGILPIGKVLEIPDAETTSSSVGATVAADNFCATIPATVGPTTGQIPWLLSQSPDRLALQPTFERWARYYGLYLPLLEAVDWQESGWQQGVVSPTGAIGVGQIEPPTAAFVDTYVVGQNLDIHATSDNIRLSAALLAYLSGIEGNNQCLTIAAYYEGTVNLQRYGVFASTETYVDDVSALIGQFA